MTMRTATPLRSNARSLLGALAVASGLVALEACSADDLVFLSASSVDGGRAADASTDGAGDASPPVGPEVDAGRDATTPIATDASAALCTVDGSAPTLALGDGGCVGDLAARAFRFGLCVCDDAVFAAGLATEALGADAGASASVGVNGNFVTTLPATVGGSLWTRQSVDSAQRLTVEGELHAATNVIRSGAVTVRSDAWVGGAINVGTFEVRGTLTQAPSQTNNASVVAGARRTAPVPATEPCDCAPASRIPVVALVQGAAGANDNAAVGFGAQSLASVGSPTTLALPCGRLYAARVETTAPLTLRVGANTVLAIAGDLRLGAAFTVELTAPNASLDILVGGTITTNSAVRIGDAARPSAVRVYVGGTTPIDTSASWELHGNLYAPQAILNTSGGAVLDGAIFVKSLAASAPVSVRYDTRVLAVPDNCGAPSGCNDCRDCRGQACVGVAPNRQCGACADSSECCAPLVCVAGRCVPEAPPR
jgi:hypothetical protein